MSGGVFMRFSIGRVGASAAHLRYITRPAATDRDAAAVRTHGLPEHAIAGRTPADRRMSLIAYAEQREDWERRQPNRRGGGQTRGHYRLVLSCEGRVETARLQALVDGYLRRTFPQAHAVSVIHQDTAHTHAHVWLDARGVDGRKLHFDHRGYRRLDEAWAVEYGRAFGPDKAAEHLAKKAETRAWRGDVARARAEGRPRPPVPVRAGRRPVPALDHRQAERQQTASDAARPGHAQRRGLEPGRRSPKSATSRVRPPDRTPASANRRRPADEAGHPANAHPGQRSGRSAGDRPGRTVDGVGRAGRAAVRAVAALRDDTGGPDPATRQLRHPRAHPPRNDRPRDDRGPAPDR